MRYIIIFSFLILCTSISSAQSISINNSGDQPDGSAMLDVQSTDKGILIPRMTTAQRESLASPANGLLVFDVTSVSFWFYDLDYDDRWVELDFDAPYIRDEDQDTEINVEDNPDDDIIRMRIEGEEAFTILENDFNAHRFHTSETSRNLFIGHNAGENSTPGFNTFLGYESGLNNYAGDQNTFVGHQAGMDNEDGDGNVILGYRAGYSNDASFNVFVGRHAGYDNISGNGNVFMGYGSGTNNLNGSNNVFLGYNTGQANSGGIENTFVGQGAGYYNSTGDFNTFVGEDSGRRNRTGNRNVALGNNAMGPNLSSGDHGDGNVALGFNAGFSMNNASSNTYVGEDAGYFNSTGDGNTLVGNESGLLMTNGRHNTALGYRAYRTNNQGNNNIAIGDSAMYNSSGDYNIVIGNRAGEESEGSGSILIGASAGSENEASNNVFIGNSAGLRNRVGNQNTFIGESTGRVNISGESNSFLGFYAGDRNSSGIENTFVGVLAGHGNTTGNSNVSLGFFSNYGNSDGSGNVAIGHRAMANYLDVNDDIERIENTAIGFEAGDNDLGNYNITVGSKSEAGDGQYNIALGYEASVDNLTTGNASHGVAIGYQSLAYGSETISIGKNASSNGGSIIIGNDGAAGVSASNAVGIGNDVTVNQSHSIILGNSDQGLVAVGVGTNSPFAKLHIDNSTAHVRALSVRQDGATALEVRDNLGVNIGSNDLPPVNGLNVEGGTSLDSYLTVDGYASLENSLGVSQNASIGNLLFVNTNVMPTDYQVAIDGKVACTEIRVQAVDDWPDYVFEDDYPLMSIDQFRSYIHKNKHLPGVPAASEIEDSGIEIGKTQEILLEKIEELSLYVLQLEERLSDIENAKNK